MKLQEFLNIVKDNFLIIAIMASAFIYLLDTIVEHIKDMLEDYYDHKQEMKEMELEYKNNTRDTE